MSEHRQLAAIMFTDIVGYSAMMSKSEKRTLQVLERNRQIHQEAIRRFSGELIKEIGDGMLSLFKTSSDALQCAIAIQEACCRQQDFRVRIGIHMAEVVIVEKDVFGDGVNIASRIEASGKSAGIYISGRVFEDVRNKIDISATDLGEKKLKNIDHPVRIYQINAVDTPGQAKALRRWGRLPGKKKKTLLATIAMITAVIIVLLIYFMWPPAAGKHESGFIAVATFENQTGDESLDPVGRMAADWITEGIAGTGLAPVAPSVVSGPVQYVHQNQDGIRELSKKTGAETIITGVYYKTIEGLEFHANIVDAGQGKTLTAIDPVKASLDNPLWGIEIVRQKVLGALAANFDEQFSYYSDRTLKPPLFDAYSEFITGVEYFFKYEYKEAAVHYLKAIHLDPDYLTPNLWLAGSYWNLAMYTQYWDVPGNIRTFQSFDSLTYFLERNRNRLTKGEQYHLDWLIGFREGNPDKMLEASQKAANFYLIFRYEMALDANMAFKPNKAIETLNSLPPDLLHFRGWYWDVLADAYHLVGDYNNELKTAEKGILIHPDLPFLCEAKIRALAGLGKREELISFLETIDFNNIDEYFGWLALNAANSVHTCGFEKEFGFLIKKSIQLFSSNADPLKKDGLPRAYYLGGQLDHSKEIFTEFHNTYPQNIDFLGYLGVIAVRQKQEAEAEEIYMELVEFDHPYLYGRKEFWLARMEALRGNREHAVELLRQSIRQGAALWYMDYFTTSLNELPDFESLRDYPPFKELIKPKD
ncbi:MAG: hypothetical protein KQI35_16625 [Bacteroidetes bacterium]|nr:hypothetical protein [Bacteroidota bacterium]